MQIWTAVSDFMCDYYTTFGAELGIVLQEEMANDSSLSFRDIMEKATTDADFRKQLIGKPVKTLAQSGLKLPDGFPLKFADGTQKKVYVPLPPFIGQVNGKESSSGGAMARLMEKAAADQAFRDKLLAGPKEALIAEGFSVPDAAEVEILESSPEAFYVVLPPMKCELPADVKVDGETVTLAGRMDTVAVEGVKPALMQWEGDMTLDMEKVGFICSAAIGLLLALHKKLNADGHVLKIKNLQPEVKNVLIISGLDGLLNV